MCPDIHVRPASDRKSRPPQRSGWSARRALIAPRTSAPTGSARLADRAGKSCRIGMGSKSGFFDRVHVPIPEAAGVSVADLAAADGVIGRYVCGDAMQGFRGGKPGAGIFARPVP